MKTGFIIAALLCAINILITYFGRVYYPINFDTGITPFSENVMVLFFAEGIVLIVLAILLMGGIIIFSNPAQDTYTFERDDLDTDPPTHR